MMLPTEKFMSEGKYMAPASNALHMAESPGTSILTFFKEAFRTVTSPWSVVA